ncbi:MAG: FAD-dependent oxidoreductase [Rickettsiales bacterium]|nr:FAD-dependent oxidoreductase [Rickettsiales bacterium]
MSKIAIIGAGFSGLVLAKELSAFADVTVFEKARGVSGRMSTRYADTYQFDHGAQFFTAKTAAFQEFLQPLISQGVVAHWTPRFVEIDRNVITGERQWDENYPHYVGMPKMNQIAKHLAEGLTINLQTPVATIEKKADEWCLKDDAGGAQGCFDWVISTAPPVQSTALLPEIFTHHTALQKTRMSGCFSLMLGFAEPLPLSWDAALVMHADISWISVNSSKPGRPAGYSLLINSTNDWAEKHLDDDRAEVQDYLCSAVSKVIGHDVSQADHIALHGWRYANIGKQDGEPSLLDAENQLAACGDWCIQGRVEAGFTSAMHLADKLKEQL